jgi:hypothetical protein
MIVLSALALALFASSAAAAGRVRPRIGGAMGIVPAR